MDLAARAGRLLVTYEHDVRPLLLEYQEAQVDRFDKEAARCRQVLETPAQELPICVLGQTGVGKSTLINSLVDGEYAVLPQGGVGPLTALATSVRYSTKRNFSVSYLSGTEVQRLIFALAMHHESQQRHAGNLAHSDAAQIGEALAEEEREEATLSLPAPDSDGEDTGGSMSPSEPPDRKVEALCHQARLMVRGAQYAELPIPYLVNALRWANQLEESSPDGIDPVDVGRLRDIREALRIARAKSGPRQVELGDSPQEFYAELRKHAAGHLAPMVKRIDVGWDAEFLKDGVVLVDLPGLGVANDQYREVTSTAIRSARAVVMVVDRSGFTEASAELLRSTGFLSSLLHDVDDPEAQVPALHVAVVKLDLTADDARLNARQVGGPVLPWREYFDVACTEADTLVRQQIREELDRVVGESPEDTRDAKRRMIERVVGDLSVHTVSGLEYRKLVIGDPDEPARIRQSEESRIPQMARGLRQLGIDACGRRNSQLATMVEGFHFRVGEVLDLLLAEWSAESKLDALIDDLRRELGHAMGPLKGEYNARRGAFREFLKETIPSKIEAGVVQASGQAGAAIDRHLRKMADYHWATLRAAVRRGGAFIGAKHIDLPNDLSLRFEEPIAIVWSRSILVALRSRTREYGNDLIELQAQLVAWARAQGTKVNTQRVERVHEELRSTVQGLGSVGREAVDELKEKVRNELYAKVEAGIRRECKKFVDANKDKGPGVKQRILEHLHGELTEAVLEVANRAAKDVLTRNYEVVRREIEGLVRSLPDPLETAGNHIVESHEISTRRADVKRRAEATKQLGAALEAWLVS